MLVWQLFFSCWKWREFLSLYKVLDLRIKEKFLTIFYWACVMYSSFVCLYIFVLFCFGFCACLLFFGFVFCICCCFFFCTFMTLNKHQIPFLIFSLLFLFFFLTNIDECKTYPGKCQVNATCNNTHQIQTRISWRWTQLFFVCCCCFLF